MITAQWAVAYFPTKPSFRLGKLDPRLTAWFRGEEVGIAPCARTVDGACVAIAPDS